MRYSKGRTAQNEKEGKTNLWNSAEYEHARDFVKDAGTGSRTG